MHPLSQVLKIAHKTKNHELLEILPENPLYYNKALPLYIEP